MSDILIKKSLVSSSHPLERLPESPWEIRFNEVEDILIPFDGTIVIPALPGTAPDFTAIGHHEFVFLPLRNPLRKPLEMPVGASYFPSLRDMNNRPIYTAKKNVIFLVENDYTLLNDFHGSGILGSNSVYDPVFRENFSICTHAKYLMIEFEDALFDDDNPIPLDVGPFTCEKNFSLSENAHDDPGIGRLTSAFALAGLLSGTIKAFDLSGHQTDAYSALLNLGIPKADIHGAPADDNKLYVQFVNIHGEPVSKAGVPLDYIDITPAPADVAGMEAARIYQLEFTGDKKMEFQLRPHSPIADNTVFHFHGHHFALWPGYNFRIREADSDTAPLTLDLVKDMDEIRPLNFLRLCLFHPLHEFQTEAGGYVYLQEWTETTPPSQQKRLLFDHNDFHFFSSRNKVSIFNCGADFFKDYYKTVTDLKAKDKLYQANWATQPFVPFLGSMHLRAIEPVDADTQSIYQQLEKTKTEFLLFPIVIEHEPDDIHKVAYLPNRLNANNFFTESVMTEVWTVPAPGGVAARTSKCVVRKKQFFGWLLNVSSEYEPALETSHIFQHRIIAYWKDRMGNVSSVELNDLLADTVELMPLTENFPFANFALEKDEHDPPRFRIRRIAQATPGTALLVVNLAAGGTYLLPLTPPGASDTDMNVVITNAEAYPAESIERAAISQLINTFSSTDELLLSICQWPATEDALLSTLVLTNFGHWQFSADKIRTGDIPLHPEELGGIFRNAISKGVELRALYWEQFLASITGGDDLTKGLSNNESVTSIINNSISSKHGFAFRDRSTRDFGSWHQKSTAIIRKEGEDTTTSSDKQMLIGYLGGIDLASGRWDTQLHHERDPDRPTGLWYDVHVKIEGEATLDILRNFRHRWKAIGVFLGPGSGFESFRPVNTSAALAADATAEFKIPERGQIKLPDEDEYNAFVQINRTIPPRSGLSRVNTDTEVNVEIPVLEGELGSMFSYIKAIESAKKFIVVNDQYFFSQEIARLLHDRLAADDGPSFLILCLPLNLAESDFIDPHLFRVRQLAIQTLYYGAEVVNDDSETPCGKYGPRESTSTKVKDKVAIVTPVNATGTAVYVHSKHLIVDDVWMTIGSANLGNRSLTFDGEINAAMVGNELYKGATSLVRNHRIEICRQLLGLPAAYSALLQDPYATFKLFKAIEDQKDSYSHRLHPQPLLCKWLDPDYVLRAGDGVVDAEDDYVFQLEFTDPSFAFLTCNGLDPEGRTNASTRLAFFAGLAGFGKTIPTAMAHISFDISAVDAAIRALILLDAKIIMAVKLSIIGSTSIGPLKIGEHNLKISTTTDTIILETQPTNVISVPISTKERYIVTLEVQDLASPGTALHQGTIEFVPGTVSPPITNGSILDAVVILT